MKEGIFEIRVEPELLKFGFNQDKVQRRLNEWLVFSLFTDGVISTGKAGKLLGITRIEFINLLQRRGIAYINYTAQELDEEFEAVKSLEVHQLE